MTDDNKMSVARALTELKMLDKRIARRIATALFIDVRKASEKTTISGISTEDADQRIKSDLQAVKDLIARRNAIKMAIVNSNAQTKVKVAGVEYTVAAAIERKNSIGYEEQVLDHMRHNISTAKAKCDTLNSSVEDQLNILLGKQMESDTKQRPEVVSQFIEHYNKLNAYQLIDPLKIEAVAEKMATEIEDFNLNVDVALSESNARTEISI